MVKILEVLDSGYVVMGEAKDICKDCGKPSHTTLPEAKQ